MELSADNLAPGTDVLVFFAEKVGSYLVYGRCMVACRTSGTLALFLKYILIAITVLSYQFSSVAYKLRDSKIGMSCCEIDNAFQCGLCKLFVLARIVIMQ
jgi:hypothetical protein